ncbi:dopamine receptor 1-like [Haliotis asinina]|uniref:dopamine receptor 1-like n=1 Tax=Haliotis asinina TaxID=109174 RepID=UPI00353248C7
MSGNWSQPTYVITPTHANLSHSLITNYNLTEKVLIGTFLCILIVVAIGGNMLVCAAVFTDRKLKRNSNFFIVSLAIADLLVAISVMTFAVANDIQGTWAFGIEFCNIWISADIMCSTASILNLCVISLDRYIHIKDPLRYEAWMTGRKTVCFIATVWILSLLISFVPIHMGWHFSSGNNQQDSLASESCVFELNPIYAVVSSTISFYIPCIVMLSIYCRLYMYAKRHADIIRRTHTAERFQAPHQASDAAGKQGGSYRVSDHKAAVTLGIIMGVFLLCWFPFFVMNPIAAFCPTCIPDVVFKILTWLGYVNSCLNPIIYSIFNQEFREAFRKILFPKCLLEYRSKSNLNQRQGRKVRKSEYAPPLVENGTQQLGYNRKNSREHLFSDRITAL